MSAWLQTSKFRLPDASLHPRGFIYAGCIRRKRDLGAAFGTIVETPGGVDMIRGISIAVALVICPVGNGLAQGFPIKPIRIIVGV